MANDFPAFGSVFPKAVLEVRTGDQTLSARVTLVSAITGTGDPSEIAYLVKPVPEQSPSDYQGGVVALSFLPAAFDFATLFIGDRSSGLTLGAPVPGELLVEIASRQMILTVNGYLQAREHEKKTIIIQNFVDFGIDVSIGYDRKNSPIRLKVDPDPLHVPAQSKGLLTLEASITKAINGPQTMQIHFQARNPANGGTEVADALLRFLYPK